MEAPEPLKARFQSAIARLLRPILRLALRGGLKHADLDDLVRSTLVELAEETWTGSSGSRPNMSQISVTTGINRKDITQRLRQPRDALAQTDTSAPARAFTGWLQLVAGDPALRRLSRLDRGDGRPSFERVARDATRGNVHPRTVLNEMVRLGMARELESDVELLMDAFVPEKDQQLMLAFLSDNGRDHLDAAVSNTLGDAPPFLERAVFARGLSRAQADAIHARVRAEWARWHHTLVEDMTAAVNAPDEPKDHRIRVGVYTYFEPIPVDNQVHDEYQTKKD